MPITESTPLSRCVFLEQSYTKTLQRVARLQIHEKDVLFKLASVKDISMNHNNNMKPWKTAYDYVVGPERQEFSLFGRDFSKEKFEGEIQLADDV